MTKAVIFGVSGETLTDDEKTFLERAQPLGVILFERNCQTPPQLKKLVKDIKECIGRDDVKILIDQEGGRISRLNRTYWRHPQAPQEFGDLYEVNSDVAYQAAYDNALLIGYDLQSLGINVNCAPLADLPAVDADPVISNRAFSPYPEITSSLCIATIQGLQDLGMIPVLKHFPGHGRATVDSHKSLPIIKENKKELYEHDLSAFHQVLTSINQLLRPVPWGMTAHVVYTAFDEVNPATFSSKVIDNIIRGYLDFQGFLISDCITMGALQGSMADRADRAIQAGCNAVLHCNGDFAEMVEVASVVPELEDMELEMLEDSMPTKAFETIDPTVLEANIKKAFDSAHTTPVARRN